MTKGSLHRRASFDSRSHGNRSIRLRTGIDLPVNLDIGIAHQRASRVLISADISRFDASLNAQVCQDSSSSWVEIFQDRILPTATV